jgi:hypothetical protein
MVPAPKPVGQAKGVVYAYVQRLKDYGETVIHKSIAGEVTPHLPQGAVSVRRGDYFYVTMPKK